MLFDLRGRGRRRTVQVIYLFLAILMGGGLVLFGIGGATSGGLVDAITGSGGSSGKTSDVYQQRITRYRKAVTADPKDTQAWAQLTRAQIQEASVAGYDQATGTYTAAGIKKLQQASDSWEKYLALDPKKPNGNVAALMINAYGTGALNDPGKAAQALAVVINDRGGTSALYSQLAILTYVAGDVRKSVIAERKAVELSPKQRRKLVKARIAAQRKQIDQQKIQNAAQQSGGGSGSSGSGGGSGGLLGGG